MIKGKKFLITQPMIHGINGSTTAALELADYLRTEGADVVIYTHHYDDPAKSFFEEKNIKVVRSQEDPEFSLSDFDYVWVHSQILPLSIIRALGGTLPKKLPKFIFHHMSALDNIPDESPYIFDLEEKLSSKTLFVSSKTQEKQMKYFTENPEFGLFKNPSPKYYSELEYTPSKDLKNILIVSNHPPQEVIEAKALLEDRGLTVTSFGETSGEYSLITPDVLKKFDMVITIGKTVQYCLTASIPVYVYDHFGGSGYLDDNSYELAADRNFSGRHSKAQTAESLVEDITSRYAAAVDYQVKNRKKFINDFSIDKILPSMLKNIKSRSVESFDLRYMNVVIAAQIFGRLRFESGARDWNNAKLSDNLSKEVRRLETFITELRENIDDLHKNVEFERERIQKIMESRSYKFGTVVAKPVRLTKTLMKRYLR